MDYLVQRDNKNFVAFQVNASRKNVLVECSAGRVLHITKQELVQATADTIEHWYPTPHVWHPDFIASLRAVNVGGEWTSEDRLDANIDIWLREHAPPYKLPQDCTLFYCGGEITVTMPLRIFYNAAEEHLKTDARLPTRNLHPAIARKLKTRWANMVERLAETEGRKRA